MAIRIDGQIYKVLEAAFKAGGGKLGGLVKSKLQNMPSGRLSEPHFRPEERLDDLALERQTMEYLYSDENNCFLMNPVTFEQVEVQRAVVGPGEKFLESGMQIPVELFEGRPLSLVLPETVEARIIETASPMHAQQDSTWKRARLENGVEIMVPLFIGPGEIVRVDVNSARYVERVRLERKKGA